MTNLVYPQLIGLGYNFVKRPIWGTSIATSATGAEVRTGFYPYPIWEFELTYEILNDAQTEQSSTASDLKTLMGFYLQTQGQLLPFCFQDPDDNTVIGGAIGEGNGTQTTWTITRFFGVGSTGLSEPVGIVNSAAMTVNVYLNGTLQSSGYSFNLGTPVNQQLIFTTPPGNSVYITMDFAFYYWVRFFDGQYDFEKFSALRWQQRKITLHSLRL